MMVFSKVAHTCVPVGCSALLVSSSPAASDPLFLDDLLLVDRSELALCISSYYNKKKSVIVHISVQKFTTNPLAPAVRARLKEKHSSVLGSLSHGFRKTRNAAPLGTESFL